MRISVLSLRFLILFLSVGLVACSSGGGSDDTDSDDDTDTTDTPVAPIFTSIVPGDGQVSLTWTHEEEPATDVTDGAPILTYNLYYANATDNEITIDDLSATYTLVTDIEAVSGYQVIADIADLSYTVTGLDNLDLYYFILTANNEDGEGDSSALEAYAMPRDTSLASQPLNDTGVSLCADYAYGIDAQDLDGDGILSFEEIDIDGDEEYFEHDNRIDCAAGDIDDDQDPIPAEAQQDFSQGLDASATDDTDGLAGFSFTKLDENGVGVAADASDWDCVQDNVTGLVWEAKSSVEDDLHYSKDRFSWYNQDSSLNGEEEGYQIPSDATANDDLGDDICFGYTDGDTSTYCNTSAFVERVNDEALCGYSDWRLPTMTELRSLIDYGVENDDQDNIVASTDLTFFPNMEVDGGDASTTSDGGIRYWSSQTYTLVPTASWSIFYGFGGGPPLDKGTPNAVRLVRSGP